MAFKLYIHLPNIHILQLIILLTLPPYLSSNDDYSKGCENLFSCGNITNIGFPFWGENRPNGCGHPLLELTCQNDISYITIKDVKYQVLEANIDEHTLRITREDYLQLEGLCPTKHVNTTLDTEIFVYGNNYNNLTLFYDCQASDPYTLASFFGRLSCLQNEASYGYVYTWFGSTSPPYLPCKESLVFPISKLLNIDIINDFIKTQEAIRDGFLVRWIAGVEECNKCLKSGGFCGWSSNQPTCYCKDQDCLKAPPQSQVPQSSGMYV